MFVIGVVGHLVGLLLLALKVSSAVWHVSKVNY